MYITLYHNDFYWKASSNRFQFIYEKNAGHKIECKEISSVILDFSKYICSVFVYCNADLTKV